MIHRDLKSDNIFCQLDGDLEIKDVAIGDFDTAKHLSGKEKAEVIAGVSLLYPEKKPFLDSQPPKRRQDTLHQKFGRKRAIPLLRIFILLAFFYTK